jgi:phage baseplate assembly protein W
MPNYAPKLPLDYNQAYGPYTSNTEINDVVKQNLKMLVLTNPGERIMIPNFGVGIKRYIFENKTSSTYASIEGKIRSQVSIYMPFVNIQKILISDLVSNLPNDYYENALQLSIYYTVPTTGISDILSITMNNQG